MGTQVRKPTSQPEVLHAALQRFGDRRFDRALVDHEQLSRSVTGETWTSIRSSVRTDRW
jgi:hypothetical protein